MATLLQHRDCLTIIISGDRQTALQAARSAATGERPGPLQSDVPSVVRGCQGRGSGIVLPASQSGYCRFVGAAGEI